ncbi:SMI1/KNR4 family protein [Rhizobacter sp. LjRoot28]|uniref:SMI1/KNR4 family protein n=1 Tax=Rhizobacter sp. LjRoot28 TaxID=3342309 RepID=UPI003ECE65E1
MDLQSRLRFILSSLSRQGFDARPLVFRPPASEAELVEVEHQLRIELPSSLRDVLAFASAHVEFRWFAPKDRRFPEPFHQNFSGDIHWSLPLLVQYARDKQQWIETVFKNPDDPYDRVWHNKLAFHEVGNGDYLAIDLDAALQGRVVYLSHDDGQGHGHVLAASFAELLEAWVPLGCPGAEDWQWMPFTDNFTGPIDPACANARQWRELLRLDA